jgi:hypothetical protein
MIRGNSKIHLFEKFKQLKQLSIEDNELEDTDVAEILSFLIQYKVLILDRLPLREKTFEALGKLDLSEL